MGERVARLETKLDSYHEEVKKMFSEEIKPLRVKVEKHGAQISLWRGAFVILGILWASVLTFFGHKVLK